MASYSLMKIAFLESLGILRWVLLIADRFIRIWQGSFEYKCNKDNFLIIMHLGVVKVGLIQLAKAEVIKLRLILTKKLDVR